METVSNWKELSVQVKQRGKKSPDFTPHTGTLTHTPLREGSGAAQGDQRDGLGDSDLLLADFCLLWHLRGNSPGALGGTAVLVCPSLDKALALPSLVA